MAIALQQAGRFAEAEKLCRAILQREPREPQAIYLLGLNALATGRHQRAAELLGRTIRLDPSFAPGYLNLGVALAALGRRREALVQYDEAVARAPGLAEAHDCRGRLLREMGEPEAAVASFDRALALRPDDPEILNSRGLALDALKRHDEALAAFDTALALRPKFPEALCNRGNALNWLKRPEEGLASFDKALRLRGDFAEAWCNRGDTLHEQKRLAEALSSFDKAVALKPDFAEAHYGRSLTLLTLGRYREGFREYEWRKQRGGYRQPTFSSPLWLGKPNLGGRSLLIYPELFLGDMLQFCRYAVLAAAQGAKVILTVQAPLVALLKTLHPGVAVIEDGQAAPRFDFHCPLLSLPLAFGTTLESVPGNAPYLYADPARVAVWKGIIGGDGLKIGICWQGSGSRPELERSFPLTAFAPLTELPGVRLICLQTGFGVEQRPALPGVEYFDDPEDTEPRPFVETAAMMANLDLIITTDTSIAHLAGALGRPTWVALKHVPDWRWGVVGDTTPWYPTVRLFRQTTPGRWEDVFAAMQSAVDGIYGPTNAPPLTSIIAPER
jgi:tetratricopeptide (TPR) repeat protein